MENENFFQEPVIDLPIVEDAVVIEEPVVEQPVVEPEVKVEPVVVETKSKKKDDTVAIYSDRDVRWGNVGTLKIGVNNVSKADADKWLAAKYFVRLAKETDK